ncbi:MAG: hypothetical protein MUF54_03880, partial [Polyangiaceae bacterium]|nr:hypothetical protein [Polyangiaceae bacterium]
LPHLGLVNPTLLILRVSVVNSPGGFWLRLCRAIKSGESRLVGAVSPENGNGDAEAEVGRPKLSGAFDLSHLNLPAAPELIGPGGSLGRDLGDERMDDWVVGMDPEPPDVPETQRGPPCDACVDPSAPAC